MKIAFLSVFYPYRGGIAQFNANLVRELEKAHTLNLWNFSRQYPDFLFPGKSQFVEENDTADVLQTQRTLDTINPISWRKTASQIKQYNPDVLLNRLWMPFFAPSLGFVAASLRKSRAKTVALLDNVIPHERRPGDDMLLRYFLRRHDGFIVMSEAVKDDVLHYCPQANITLKPHPIYSHFGAGIAQEKARSLLGLPKEANIILFFGFIRQYKGLDVLLKSMRQLSNNYHLVVAGEVYGDYAPYEKIIKENGLADRVHNFIEYIEDKRVPAFFSASDLCVLPYRSATQSGIAQIAWHFHLPLLVARAGGLSEMVQENETGLIAEELHPEALAAKIRSYFDNDLKDKFSATMASRRDRYGWQGFTQSIVEFMQEL